MKISALRLFNVKRFGGRGVAIENIGDGVNVLCAANEVGKSTSFEALHALFFHPHSSTASDIRDLRPYSSGNPLIEADIATEQGRFRITKQYYGGRSARVTDIASGRLVAQADEAENFIATLVQGGTAGPAGLLWVRQGVTGLEKRAKSDEESERQVRASLLESVQGEVEAITGGRRISEIIQAVEECLSDLVTTTGRPKAGGRYHAAIAERDRLAEEERKLSGDVTALRDALDKRAHAVGRLAELDGTEDRQQRQQDIIVAQAAFDTAKAQGEVLKTAEAELKHVREQRGAAARELGAFRSALATAKELQNKQINAERHRGDAVDRRRSVSEAIETARAHAEAAETEEREARSLLARLEAAEKAREASERLAEFKERLSHAEATRIAIEEAEANLALVRIPPRAVEELQALEIEIAKLRAIEEAARPSVVVNYEYDFAARVTMDGTPLMSGDERTYDAQALLSVPGIGTIALQSNRPVRSDNRLEQAEAKRHTLLASMGVGDIAGARTLQQRAQQLDAELKLLRIQLSTFAPDGLPKLRTEVAARSVIDTQALELKADPVHVRSAMVAAEKQSRTAKLAVREVEPSRRSADDAFVAAEAALASLNGERTQIDAVLGPEDARGERELVLSRALSEIDLKLTTADAHAAALRAAAVDLESVEATLNRARSVEAAVAKEINALRETVVGLSGQIGARSDDAVEEKWGETKDALTAAETRVKAFELEVAVSQRLLSALETSRSQSRDLYVAPVISELKPLLGLLFDDVSIEFDDRTLLPQAITRDGLKEEVEHLSGGMREQLSVLTRLAFARLLARDGRPAPVILDDALVYSDDDRIEKMFDALHRQSRDQQIIVFSCRQRAFQRLGGNALQMTDWRP